MTNQKVNKDSKIVHYNGSQGTQGSKSRRSPHEPARKVVTPTNTRTFFAGSKFTSPPSPQSLPKPPMSWFFSTSSIESEGPEEVDMSFRYLSNVNMNMNMMIFNKVKVGAC